MREHDVMSMKKLRCIFAAAAMGLLAACGGGEAPDTSGPVDSQASVTGPRALAVGSPGASDDIRVVSLTKVAETRVSRTVYDYTYRLTVRNAGNRDLASVIAQLDSVGAGSTIIDSTSYLGAMSSGQTKDAADTVVIRHDRVRPFNDAALAWRFRTLAAANPESVAASVSQAVLKPGVINVDGVLATSLNPNLLVDSAGGAWQSGQLLIRDGDVYRVIGSRPGADGRTLVSVEPRPFYDAFDKLGFTMTLNPLLYSAKGEPLVPAAAGKRVAQAAGRKAGQPVVDNQLREQLGLPRCIQVETPTTLGAGDLGYTLRVICPLNELLNIESDALKAVSLDGSIVYAGRSTYVFDTDRRDNFVQETRSYDASFTAVANAAALIRQIDAVRGKCKLDGADAVTCSLPFYSPKPIPFAIPVAGGVSIKSSAQFKLQFVITLKASGQVELLGFSAGINRVSGMRDGVTVDRTERDPNSARVSIVPRFSVEGGFEGGVEAGVDLNIGIIANTSSSVAQVGLAIGPHVVAGARSDPSSATGLCKSSSVEGVFTASTAFFPVKAFNFEGIPFFSWPVRFWSKELQSEPLGCADPLTAAAFRFPSPWLRGTDFYAVDEAASGVERDVYRVSGAWLLKKQAGESNPYFEIDLKRLLDLNGLRNDDVAVTASVQFSLDDKGATTEVVTEIHRETQLAHPVVRVHPGTTRPGQSLTVDLTARDKNRPERIANRQVVLNVEPTLDAAPVYTYAMDADGRERYSARFNYKGLTSSLMSAARIEFSNGDVQWVNPKEAADANGQTYTYWPDWDTLDVWAQNGVAVIPVALVLDSKATADKTTSYRFPLVKNTAVTARNPLTLSSNPALIGDRLTLEVFGENLPRDIKVVIPACPRDDSAFEEVLSEGVKRSGQFSTEYRKFRCIPKLAGDSVVTVLDGLASAPLLVAYDGDTPTIVAMPTPTVVGQAVEFVLSTLGDVSRWLQRAVRVVWDFGADLPTKSVELLEQTRAKVSQVFSSEGLRTITAYFLNEYNNIVGRTSTSLSVGPSAIGPVVESVSPLTATVGVPQTFVVTGSRLPDDLSFAVADCSNVTPILVGASATRREFTCTFPVGLASGLRDGAVGLNSNPFAPGLKTFSVDVKAAAVRAVSPSGTIRSLATSFDIAGVDLPTSGISVNVIGDPRSSCQAPHNLTPQGFGVACELFKIGEQVLEVRAGTVVIGSVTVQVRSNVSAVTWTSSNTSSSGTVRFNEAITFTVHGENLRADPVMGFAVEKCGVANTEVGVPSDRARTFTCFFNDQASATAGLMTGVVKDSPGGQVLFGGPENVVQPFKVPVEVSLQPMLFDEFLGSSIDTSKWNIDGWEGTGNDYTGGLGRGIGPVSVGNGLVEFGRLGRISTKNKVTFSGDSSIVIEGRTASTGALHDTSVMLVDTTSGDQILMGDTNYAGWGFYAIGIGSYKLKEASTIGDPTNPLTLGSSTTAFMEYRLTITGDRIKIERGPTLANITQTGMGTLGRSVVGRTFHISIGAAWAYYPATWDWIRVVANPGPPTAGLVGHWSFDNCDARDAGPNALSGTFTGTMACVDGRKGKALRLNGASWITVPTSAAMPSAALTVSYWLHREGLTPSGLENYISKEGSFQAYLNANLTSQFGIQMGGSGLWTGWGNSATLLPTLNDWVHYAFTYDNATRQANTYLNGTLVHSVTETNANAVLRASSQTMFIGRNGSANVYHVKGLLDDVRLYNRALPADEIRSLAR